MANDYLSFSTFKNYSPEERQRLLGKRIMLIGRSCTGKSTLAHCLGEWLERPVLYLDQIAHHPNSKWVRRDAAAMLNDFEAFLATHEEWVIEGNYSLCMPQRIMRADCVIWLHHESTWGYLKRYLKRCFFDRERKGQIEGARDQFSWELLRYTLLKAPQKDQRYKDFMALNPKLNVLLLKAGKEADHFKQLFNS